MTAYHVRGIRNVRQLRSEIDRLWQDETLRAQMRDQGIDIGSLPSSSDDAIQLTRTGAGLEPGTTAIIVAFSPVAARIVADVWTKFLLPRLEARFGMRSIDRPS